MIHEPTPRPIAWWRQLIASACVLALVAVVYNQVDKARALLGVSAPAADEWQSRRPRRVPVIAAPVRMTRDSLTLRIVGTGRAVRRVMLRAEDAGRIERLEIAPNRAFEPGDVLMQLENDDEAIALALARARYDEALRVEERVASLENRGVATSARMTEVATAAEVARLTVDQAQKALQDRTLTAPFAGVTGLPLVEVGAWIDSDVDLATFDDRSALLVEFDVPETALQRLTIGATVTATTSSVPGRTFDGTVSEIDSRVAEESRTARVRVRIANRDDALRPGASFTVTLDLPGETAASVPELATLFGRDGLFVWRIADGTAEQVPVTMVRRRAGRVLIEGPLAEGDLVVVEGTQRLDPGTPVRIANEPEPNA